jgi:hypothetical protein
MMARHAFGVTTSPLNVTHGDGIGPRHPESKKVCTNRFLLFSHPPDAALSSRLLFSSRSGTPQTEAFTSVRCSWEMRAISPQDLCSSAFHQRPRSSQVAAILAACSLCMTHPGTIGESVTVSLLYKNSETYPLNSVSIDMTSQPSRVIVDRNETPLTDGSVCSRTSLYTSFFFQPVFEPAAH